MYDGSLLSLQKALKASKPGIVFHLAAVGPTEHKPEEIGPMIQSNILLGTQLLEAMTQARCRYLVNAGTYWQHYGGKGYNPVNLYAATKQAFEAILCFYTETTGLHALTLKLFDVYCPGDKRGKFFSQLQKAAEQGRELAMSPGRQKLYLLYAADAARAFVQAARLLEKGKKLDASYAARPARALSLREAVERYQRLSRKPVKVLWGKLPYRRRQIMVPWSGKLLPGWKASTGLEAGIRRLLNQKENA